MALVLANRVQETATPNTTVSFTLTGAVSGFQTFAVIGNTNTTYYSATDTAGNWEVGEGTYSTTGPTLARTTVYASSNSGSAVTFPGSVNVFVTYPSGKSVNLDGSGNVSALGTVTSGVWQGSTVGVAYGGTGVTSSSGPNSVVLRDANSNITVNRINQGLQTVTATGGTTTLTVASQFNQALVGTGNHTFRLPDATTLSATTAFQFNNNATGTLTIENNAGTTVGTIASGGAAGIALLSNATVGGTWDVHAYIPENVTWGTNALALGSTVISGGTWQGGTIQSGYGGTGLTTFTGANNALYSTSASALTAGTLPIVAGGTGQTTQQAALNALSGTQTANRVLRSNGTNVTLSQVALATDVSGTLAIANGGTGQTTQQAALNALSGTQVANRVLRSNGTNVTLSQVALATDVSGTLPTANGGTNLTTFGAANRALYSISAGALTAGILPVAAGGTGTSSPSLIAGTNITICGAWPNQTINASGGGGGVCCAYPTVAGKVYGYTVNACSGSNTGLGYGINFGFANSCNVVIGNSSTWNRYAASCNVVIGAGANACCCAVRNVLVGKSASVYFGTACAVAVGKSAVANSYGVSIGVNSVSGQNYNVAIGSGAYSASCSSIAIGRSASASFCCTFAPQAVAIGPFASTNGANTVVIGSSASTTGFAPFVSDGAIAIGNAASAGYQNAIAIGNGVTASGSNQTHIKPIRNAAGPFTLRYNPTTGEITYN